VTRHIGFAASTNFHFDILAVFQGPDVPTTSNNMFTLVFEGFNLSLTNVGVTAAIICPPQPQTMLVF